MDLGLRHRVALVSGAHRGTGAAIARQLAAEGATVLVHGFERGQADGVVAAIRDGRLTTREALERLGSAAKGERLFAAADVRSATSRSRLSRTDRTLAAASPKASAMSTAVPATDVIRA